MAEASATLDTRGLKCPLPVLKLEKRLVRSRPGAMLTVLATDPIARIDIALYCRQNGHACEIIEQPDWLEFRIVTGATPDGGGETE